MYHYCYYYYYYYFVMLNVCVLVSEFCVIVKARPAEACEREAEGEWQKAVATTVLAVMPLRRQHVHNVTPDMFGCLGPNPLSPCTYRWRICLGPTICGPHSFLPSCCHLHPVLPEPGSECSLGIGVWRAQGESSGLGGD